MDILRKNWKRISVLALLVVGLVVGLYLVQHPQIFKPKAANEDIKKALQGDFHPVEDTNQDGILVPTFEVNSRKFKIHYSP